MLKGLKSKKVDKKQSDPKPQKKWKKTEEIPQQQNQKSNQELTFEEKIAEQEQTLIKLTENTWNAFLEGNEAKAVKVCEELFIKQRGYFDKVFKGEKYMEKQQYQLFDQQEMEQKIQSDIHLNSNKSLNFESKEIDSKIKADKLKDLKKNNFDTSAVDFFSKYKASSNLDDLINTEYDDTALRAVDDDKDKKQKSKKDQRYEERKEKKQQRNEGKQQHKTEKVLSSCKHCLANNQTWQEQIVSLGTSTVLVLPKYQRYQKQFHLCIVPLDHFQTLTEIDEEVYDEIRNFMKCLVACFDKQDLDVIFFENAVKLSSLPHCIVECVVLPRSVSAKTELYFRKEIDEIDGDWSVHKKRIDINREKGGILKQVPKKFPYFYVDFNLSFGYAHVIEDEESFSKNFAHEIVATILQIDKPKVCHPEKATKKEIFDKKIKFQKVWEEFDWTKML